MTRTRESKKKVALKWRIACINWSHKDAPHGAAYYIDGDRLHDYYFPTWAEAVAWVDKITRKP